MTNTLNLNLNKPDLDDIIDISVLNANSDILDKFAGSTNGAIAGKQDTISDLATIRSGAAAGATAVQLRSLKRISSGKRLRSELSRTRGRRTSLTSPRRTQ